MEFPMTNIEAKSIVDAFTRIRRSAKERDLALLNERAYRGVPNTNMRWLSDDKHGIFTYRGVEYAK
ncbi:MAG: hypothetical protein CBB80_011330 [Synechococcus sp. TMED20]|jgi:hypothetical protein|nr:MAG: hypothetical protein CBB80_011330 [Synechococcus sp. TMED20]|tara:strand:+ start:790 stop:987 length:198 start_codon:yes stop_codon:yes gene_type:complete